jgi:hypothetical protein
MAKELPSSPEQVLRVISDAERHRKFVWTASRVLKEAGHLGQIAGRYGERKIVLKRIAGFLHDLAQQGFLQRRDELQSIGFGNEIGFDFVASPQNQRDRG